MPKLWARDEFGQTILVCHARKMRNIQRNEEFAVGCDIVEAIVGHAIATAHIEDLKAWRKSRQPRHTDISDRTTPSQLKDAERLSGEGTLNALVRDALIETLFYSLKEVRSGLVKRIQEVLDPTPAAGPHRCHIPQTPRE